MNHILWEGEEARREGTPLLGNPYAFTLCGNDRKAEMWESAWLKADAEIRKLINQYGFAPKDRLIKSR